MEPESACTMKDLTWQNEDVLDAAAGQHAARPLHEVAQGCALVRPRQQPAQQQGGHVADAAWCPQLLLVCGQQGGHQRWVSVGTAHAKDDA